MASGSNIVWVGIGLIAFAFLGPAFRPAPPRAARPGKPAVHSATAPVEPASQVSVNMANRELVRAADGHFYADAMVNGAQVHFLIDTGASMVALTPADAQRAGIALPAERVTARGAGGTIEVAPIVIERIAIGPLEARGVSGAVARELPISLLGQSFLERVGRVEISGDRMVLR
ncbi:MAG: aspartyl protease family protein [Sphingomonadales bacterium]|jgi:aspartyl protease family protein|nr:aspartyl protease family protein [Sphingomonadales bacterium]